MSLSQLSSFSKPSRPSQFSTTLHPGYAGLPTTPEAHKVVQELLEKDRRLHHCFHHAGRFHNHLSHQLLAVYDLGGSAPLLRAIYDSKGKILVPIDDPASGPNGANGSDHLDITITTTNWTEHLGIAQSYESYISFFSAQVEDLGVVEVLDRYLFSEAATQARMLNRLTARLCHPLIQLGYGTEFGGNAAVAQGLAQAAVHVVTPNHSVLDPEEPSTVSGTPILEIMKQFCESDVLVPPPYDPHPAPGKINTIMNMGGGRLEKIRELTALWLPSSQLTDDVISTKVEELSWLAAILLRTLSETKDSFSSREFCNPKRHRPK